MATNLWSKSAKSAYSPLIVAMAFQNGFEYHNSARLFFLIQCYLF